MNIVVTTRHADALPAGQEQSVKDHAQTHAEKLTRYYDQVQEIDVTIDFGKTGHDGHRCEIVVDATHRNEFIAECSDDNPLAAVDACVEKLKRQLTEHKEKHRNRKHPN